MYFSFLIPASVSGRKAVVLLTTPTPTCCWLLRSNPGGQQRPVCFFEDTWCGNSFPSCSFFSFLHERSLFYTPLLRRRVWWWWRSFNISASLGMESLTTVHLQTTGVTGGLRSHRRRPLSHHLIPNFLLRCSLPHLHLMFWEEEWAE